MLAPDWSDDPCERAEGACSALQEVSAVATALPVLARVAVDKLHAVGSAGLVGDRPPRRRRPPWPHRRQPTSGAEGHRMSVVVGGAKGAGGAGHAAAAAGYGLVELLGGACQRVPR